MGLHDSAWGFCFGQSIGRVNFNPWIRVCRNCGRLRQGMASAAKERKSCGIVEEGYGLEDQSVLLSRRARFGGAMQRRLILGGHRFGFLCHASCPICMRLAN